MFAFEKTTIHRPCEIGRVAEILFMCVHTLITRKFCAVMMRNALLRNHLLKNIADQILIALGTRMSYPRTSRLNQKVEGYLHTLFPPEVCIDSLDSTVVQMSPDPRRQQTIARHFRVFPTVLCAMMECVFTSTLVREFYWGERPYVNGIYTCILINFLWSRTTRKIGTSMVNAECRLVQLAKADVLFPL